MKIQVRNIAITLAALACMTVLSPPSMSHSLEQAGQPGQILSAAEALAGTQVRDSEGLEIGSVREVILHTGEGKIAYLVVSASEDAEQQMIIPWRAIRTEPAGATAQGQPGDFFLVVNIPRDHLQQAPQGDAQAVLDRRQERRIHQFYGVSPYWEGNQEAPQEQMIDQPLPPGHPPVGPGLPPGHPPVLPPDHPPITPEGQMPQEQAPR